MNSESIFRVPVIPGSSLASESGGQLEMVEGSPSTQQSWLLICWIGFSMIKGSSTKSDLWNNSISVASMNAMEEAA